jgi:hypothetical protein
MRAKRLDGISSATYWLVLADAAAWTVWSLLTGEYAAGVPALVNGPVAIVILHRLLADRHTARRSESIPRFAKARQSGRNFGVTWRASPALLRASLTRGASLLEPACMPMLPSCSRACSPSPDRPTRSQTSQERRISPASCAPCVRVQGSPGRRRAWSAGNRGSRFRAGPPRPSIDRSMYRRRRPRRITHRCRAGSSRLSSVRRLTTSAVRATSLTRDCDGSHASPPSSRRNCAAIAPQHVLMREPLAGRAEVAIQFAPDDRLQLSQHVDLRRRWHRSLLTPA